MPNPPRAAFGGAKVTSKNPPPKRVRILLCPPPDFAPLVSVWAMAEPGKAEDGPGAVSVKTQHPHEDLKVAKGWRVRLGGADYEVTGVADGRLTCTPLE